MKTIRSFERDAEAAGGASGDEPGLPAPELMKAFRLLAEAKTAAVGEWIKEALIDGDPTGGKVLIFAHHHSVHDGWRRRCARRSTSRRSSSSTSPGGRPQRSASVGSPSSRRSGAAASRSSR